MITTIIIFSIILILVIIAIYAIKTYNKFINTKEMIANAKGQISAQLESRWDALTNLISATKEYQSHEADTLSSIVEKRTPVSPSSSVKDFEENEQHFQKVLDSVNVVVEQYPDLKASQIYDKTMTSVNDYEQSLRQARMIYNDTVTKYNRAIKVFPASVIASLTHFTEEDYFEESASKTEMPTW